MLSCIIILRQILIKRISMIRVSWKVWLHIEKTVRGAGGISKNLTSRIPTRGEEGTSPKTWMATVDIAIDRGLKLGLTQWRHT
jgi:hypothetical protein